MLGATAAPDPPMSLQLGAGDAASGVVAPAALLLSRGRLPRLRLSPRVLAAPLEQLQAQRALDLSITSNMVGCDTPLKAGLGSWSLSGGPRVLVTMCLWVWQSPARALHKPQFLTLPVLFPQVPDGALLSTAALLPIIPQVSHLLRVHRSPTPPPLTTSNTPLS